MKNISAKFSLVVAIAVLLAIAGTALFCVSNVANSAINGFDGVSNVANAIDEATAEVIKAPVSNLEGNATAGKSTVYIYYGSHKIYIPQSYFLQVVRITPPRPDEGVTAYICDVKYCDENYSLYLTEEPTVSNITLSEDESLYPDVRLTLKEGANVTVNGTVITNDYTIKFIGYGEDENQIYVNATLNGNTYSTFVSVSDVEPFSVPYQKKTQAERDALLASKNEPKPPIGGDLTPSTSVALRIIIIIGIAIPAVIIVLLLFKPSKGEKRYAKNSVRNSRGRGDVDYDDSRSYSRSDDRRTDRGYDDRYDGRNDRRDDRDYDRDERRSYDDRDYRRDRRDYDDRDYDRRDRRDDR